MKGSSKSSAGTLTTSRSSDDRIALSRATAQSVKPIVYRLSGVATLTMWAVSLAAPAVEDAGGRSLGWQIFFVYPMLATMAAKAHWSGLLFLLAWASNILLLYACGRLLRADTRTSWLVASLWAATLFDAAFPWIWLRARPTTEAGTYALDFLGVGYWLWLGALLIASIGTSFSHLPARSGP